jgi:probable O-glycosylation ligase (exosortase A-associated)
MKGLILTYAIATLASIGALRNPLLGLYAYVGFAILRPQAIFGWAGDLDGVSFMVGVALLIGWAVKGFGSWRFGRGNAIVVVFLSFVTWYVLSAIFALDPSRSTPYVIQFFKTILPVLVGVTMMDREEHWRRLLWTIVLAQGYVGFEMNLEYVTGNNIAAEGFGGMDNNFFGATLVTMIGPALALAIASRTWWEKALAWGCAALILHTALLTFSRGAFVGLVAVGVVAFVMMPKRPRYLGALALVLLIVIRFTGPELAARYSTILLPSEERDGSAQSRLDLWEDTLIVIRDHPVFGIGPANWRAIAATYGWTQGKSAHSVWMETAAENGIPGALLLFSFFMLAAVRLWPLARAKLTDENRYAAALASGVVLGVVGFAVSGQFVSAPSLEAPYYLVMLGISMLKIRPAPVAEVETSRPREVATPVLFAPPPAAVSRQATSAAPIRFRRVPAGGRALDG